MVTLTNQEFGDKVGVGHSMASRIIRGKRLPGTRTIHRIHASFDIPLEDLLMAHDEGAEAFGELIRERLRELAHAGAI
jgi:transcriptional regulator with XRE-family HTH domain